MGWGVFEKLFVPGCAGCLPEVRPLSGSGVPTAAAVPTLPAWGSLLYPQLSEWALGTGSGGGMGMAGYVV